MPYDECSAPTAASVVDSTDPVTSVTASGQPATPGDGDLAPPLSTSTLQSTVVVKKPRVSRDTSE